MKLPNDWKLRLSPLAEATLGRPLVEPFLEVLESSDSVLQVASNYGDFVFDRQRRVVLRDGEAVAEFGAVKTVDISTLPGRDEARSWAISLYIGMFNRITVGRTCDDGDASVVAAKISRVIGCKVLAMRLGR